MKFAFVDGEKLCLHENGTTTVSESKYLLRARESALRSAKSKEWKRKTDMLVDDELYFDFNDDEVHSRVHCVSHTDSDEKMVYSFSVGGTSGIYYQYVNDKEKTEAHLISSNEVEFVSFSVCKNGKILSTVQTSSVCANIAIVDKTSGDFQYLTGGDSLDENPSLDENGNILFNSFGVGRDQNNAFVAYGPSEIYRFNFATKETELILSDDEYSYVKPISDGEGNFYCIRKPAVDAPDENIFLQILLIPVRIVQAIVGFISAFVSCFAKKPLIQGQTARSIGNGGDAVKNGANARKMMINNHLVNVDKELKRNKKWSDLGFIPRNWVLVKICPKQENKDEYTGYDIAYGVGDFCLIKENGEKHLIYTTGCQIHEVIDHGEKGKRNHLFNVDCCVKVNALSSFDLEDELSLS